MATAAAGVKRKPSDIGDHERLAKRFEVLNLDANGHKHYLPVASEAQQQQHGAVHAPSGGLMEVEDTRDRVYIHDLDKELAEVEERDGTDDGRRPIFIPDIERHLNALPRRLLEAREPGGAAAPQDRQLVLYSVPSSISVAREDDSVRKVLVESRNRARLEQRARIKREQRGDMEIEEQEQEQEEGPDAGPGSVGNGDRPKRVFARLKWKEAPPDGQPEAPMPMHMEDADESTPEPMAPSSPSFTVEEMESDNDAMELG